MGLPTKLNDIFNRRNVIGVILAVAFIRVLFWVSCGQKEKIIPIPSFLDGVQVVFDRQMYYQIGIQQEKTQSFETIGREIVTDKSLDKYYPDRFVFEPVSTSTKFTVIGALNNANCGLNAIDSGTTGVDFLIMQDERGNQSLIAYMNFYTSLSNGRLEKVTNASYYKNGQKVDYIRESDFVLKKSR